MTKVDEIVESNFLLSSNSTASSAVQPKLPPALDERMNCLEEQVYWTFSIKKNVGKVYKENTSKEIPFVAI